MDVDSVEVDALIQLISLEIKLILIHFTFLLLGETGEAW